MAGGNINPVVRVTIGDQVKQTRVKKSTNRPYYNQVKITSFVIVSWRAQLNIITTFYLIKPGAHDGIFVGRAETQNNFDENFSPCSELNLK